MGNFQFETERLLLKSGWVCSGICKSIGVIEVSSGVNKPYVLSGAIYVRQGPNTQKLTTAEQMRDFFQQADKIFFDEKSCPEFKPETMLDNDFLQLFKIESKISAAVSDEQIFKNLKLLNDSSQFKNGGVLFFGKEPNKIIDTAMIRCVAYRGVDKRFIKDDKPYGGNLYAQYMQSLDWLHSKLDVAYDIEGQGSGPRKEIWEIPETVFKEAIINALSHRDYYDKGAIILVELFDDRVEISNPGGLVNTITQAEFGTRSFSRNPLVFGLFLRMQLVEKVGSGINRMNDLMKAAGLPKPTYNTEGMFVVKLVRSGVSVKKGSVKSSVKSSVKIIEMIAENRNITIPEMADRLEKSTRAIEKQVAKLKLNGTISRIGPDKDGHWVVLDKG